MKKKIFKQLALTILIVFVSIAANILLHEIGHFAVAGSLGLDPAMHLESPVSVTGGHVAATPNFAYVNYNSIFPGSTFRDALVALGGPLVNGILALCAAGLYMVSPKKKKTIPLILLLVSIASLVVNLIPIAPSDGSVILSYFVK